MPGDMDVLVQNQCMASEAAVGCRGDRHLKHDGLGGVPGTVTVGRLRRGAALAA